MKFYVVIADNAEPIACEFSKAKAIKAAKAEGSAGTRVDAISLCVTPREAIRRLLGNVGGYSKEVETVYEIPRED